MLDYALLVSIAVTKECPKHIHRRVGIKNHHSKQGISVAEAGRRGGRSTLEKQGRDFFSRIGKKGGERTAKLYHDLLSEFGRRGGRPRRPNLDKFMRKEDHQ